MYEYASVRRCENVNELKPLATLSIERFLALSLVCVSIIRSKKVELNAPAPERAPPERCLRVYDNFVVDDGVAMLAG